MILPIRSPSLVAVGVLLTKALSVSALDIAYCSNLNTADGPGNVTQFMSNGVCYDQCIDNFAYAINQGNKCWCSDYTPGATSDMSECNIPCPGFPDDNCGGQGRYAYQALPMQPSGTKGGPETTSSSTTSSSTDPVTVVQTVTASDSKTTDSSASSSSSSSTTWTPTPITSLETVTGQVRTVTLTPTVPPTSQSLDVVSSKSKGGSGLGTGGAVGLAVGLVAAAAIVSVGVWFCLRKRRNNRGEQPIGDQGSLEQTGSAGLGGAPPMRTMSEHSRYVLGTDGRNVVEAWEPESTPSASTRRNSRLMPIDQRLDPYQALYMHHGKSGESVVTLQDNRDYSRRVQTNLPILRMTNPDADPPG